MNFVRMLRAGSYINVLKTQGAPCKWEHFAYKNRERIEEPQEILLDK